ncbi:ATP-binding cassette sub-family A member 3-like [Hyposmocoma kahamanoa]|uniref:ATP-binding cassette sub-family A member 3-like n=1 Tax=Hyposmocoma kahamanoa TaxID=1477025 RepID=UPI000E6D96C0|nr:ATP-binding cassette sub-family A member 3-like [Hyposmocoma kahamanoa]
MCDCCATREHRVCKLKRPHHKPLPITLKQPSAWEKFKLLMWKNSLLQVRNRGQTIAELLVPIVTMALILIIRCHVDPLVIGVTKYPKYRADTLNFSLPILYSMNLSELSIGYSPQSPILEEVVKAAMAKLFAANDDIIKRAMSNQIKLPNLTVVNNTITLPSNVSGIDLKWNITLPDKIKLPDNTTIQDFLATLIKNEIVKNLLNVKAYNKSSDLNNIYSKEKTTREVLCVIEFSDSLAGATTLPDDLSYSLRFPDRPRLNSFFAEGSRTWYTDVLYPFISYPGPRSEFSVEGGNEPGYTNEMFVAVMHVVSMELIERRTGKNLASFIVYMQRYPHPPYVKDYELKCLQLVFPMFIMLSFSYTAVNIVRAITVEKELGLKEAMTIMGLPTWLHWTAWFCKQFIYLFIVVVLIVFIIKLPWFSAQDGFRDYAVFSTTPWHILFMFLILYVICIIFFCFLMSCLFSRANAASLFTAVFWFLTYIPAFLVSVEVKMPMFIEIISCLNLNTAMAHGFSILLSKESVGGMRWNTWFYSPSEKIPRLLFGHVVIMMIVDAILYLILTLYLEQVLPGPFGNPQKWYFLFHKSYWMGIPMVDDAPLNESSYGNRIVKEKDPREHTVGVKIKNLTKTFGTFTAVNNLSLNIYNDQVTVLLGHNGAGKSTTISMITGNVGITQGSVRVAGYDITQQKLKARAHLGRSMLLTTHFMDEADILGDRVAIMSAGSLQCVGSPYFLKQHFGAGYTLVIVKSESFDVDACTQLLNKYIPNTVVKEDRGTEVTYSLSNESAHIFEEMLSDLERNQNNIKFQNYGLVATTLEDVFMAVGSESYGDNPVSARTMAKFLQCKCGKCHFRATGQRGRCLFDTPQRYCCGGTEIPDDEKCKFDPALRCYCGREHTLLECPGDKCTSDGNSKGDRKGASASRKHGGKQPDKFADDTTDGLEFDSLGGAGDTKLKTITGPQLLINQILATWMKLFLVWSRSWTMILLQFLTPILLINSTLAMIAYATRTSDAKEKRALVLTTGFAETETLLNYDNTGLGASSGPAYEEIFNQTAVAKMRLNLVNESISDYYLERASNPLTLEYLRNQLLVGATFESNEAIAWFSNFGYHDSAMSLAYVHAAIFRGLCKQCNMSVYNYPLQAHYTNRDDTRLLLLLLASLLANGIGNSVGVVSAMFVMFYIKERTNRVKLLQKAAGLSPVVMWGSAFVFDWVLFVLVNIPILISCALFRVIGISTFWQILRLFILLVVYGASMLPFVYICSYLFRGPGVGFVALLFLNVLFGMLAPQIVDILWLPYGNTRTMGDLIDAVVEFHPLYGFVTCVRSLSHISLVRHMCYKACEFMQAVMTNITECSMATMCAKFSEACCIPEHAHWSWVLPGVLRYVIVMILSGVVGWCILMIAEYRVLQKIFYTKRVPPPLNEKKLDDDVLTEMRHVEEINKRQGDHSLVVNKITKYYGNYLAVNQVSFTVSESECFGLLGINGAGKTTTFKMLMGDEMISSGDAYVAGYSVRTEMNKVYRHIGYCPQFDAVFDEMTGRETMKFFSMLRGLQPTSASKQTVMLAKALGFTKYLDKTVSEHYCGGTKRKLSTAVALLGQTRLLFVDEPTTGMDPAASRKVWTAIQGARSAGRGIILTSHSMEECEALCSRLTVMVDGGFQCLGTPQHLKTKFSQGFILTIKLKADDESDEALREEHTNAMKNYISKNFKDSKLMEEYQGLITYYLPETGIPWSHMFGIMEYAKRELYVEDYSISQTTLQQIFLQFTKYRQPDSGNIGKVTIKGADTADSRTKKFYKKIFAFRENK